MRGDQMKSLSVKLGVILIGHVLVLFLLANCAIPSQETRRLNRENWKLTLMGEPIENVIEVWGIPTGQIKLTGNDGEDYFIYNWERSWTYIGGGVYAIPEGKPDKYNGGKVVAPACKNFTQKLVKRVWAHKSGKIFNADIVYE